MLVLLAWCVFTLKHLQWPRESIIRGDVSHLCTSENWKDIPFPRVYWYTWKLDIFLHFLIVLTYFQEGWWNDDVHLASCEKKKRKLNLKGFHSVQNNFLFQCESGILSVWESQLDLSKIIFLSCVLKSFTSSVSACTQLLC